MLKTRATQASTGQTLTVSGLTGNADGYYVIRGRLIVPSATANTITLRPNGLNTNLYSRIGANNAAGTAQNEWRLGGAWSSSFTGVPVLVYEFNMLMYASKSLNGTAIYSSYWCDSNLCGDLTNNQSYSWQSHGTWDETSTELTSLEFRSSDASGIEAGSEILVFSPTQTFNQ